MLHIHSGPVILTAHVGTIRKWQRAMEDGIVKLSKLHTIVLATVAASGLAFAAGCQNSSSVDEYFGPYRMAPAKGKEVTVENLRAGPIQMKFKDGELRYLYVGDKEIVRRMFFAVRDGNWATPMPVFSKIDVEQKADSFKISLAATCQNDTVDYAWTGQIIGTAEGQITFSVTGTPQKDFKSNRIGICVLYGADSLSGQPFQTLQADDPSAEGLRALGAGFANAHYAPGKFFDLVSLDLVAKDYKNLTYTADGVTVVCSLAPILFTMEDQRNYGDSSFKAYNSVLTGPDALKGQKATVTATLKVTGAKAAPPAAAATPAPVHVVIGKPLDGVKLPKLVAADAAAKIGDFLSFDAKRNELKDETALTFGYKPSEHLPDDDTYMENRTAIFWQLKTMHARAPKAKLRVALRFGDKPDPRSTSPFAAAWAVGALKELALGHADEATFAMDISPIASVLEKFSVADATLLNVDVKASGRAPVEVLALRKNGRTLIMIANSTNTAQKIVLDGVPLTGPGEIAPYGIYSTTIEAKP